MGNFICNICQKEYDNIKSLRGHIFQKHNLDSDKIYIEYVLNGVPPKCECGCGRTPPFITISKGFSRFIRGHHNRVKGKNNFHKNPETHQKAIETQKKNWKEGKYVGWWENKTPETLKKIEGIKEKLRNDKKRAKLISDKLSGIPKTEESKRKLSITQKKRYEENPELRKTLSERRLNWFKKRIKDKKSNLECKFEKLLSLLDIKFQYQYEFKNRLFDFYLEKFETLIEVDGDFYHCNPNSKHCELKYEVQKITKDNDDFKDKLCYENNIKLFRYWEKDINERPEWVISDLREKLSL